PVQNNFEDRFEPNESFAAAANIGVGPGVHLQNLSIATASDNDWYKFQLLRPDTIDVSLGFVHGQELSLEVRDANNTLLGTSSSTAAGSTVALNSANLAPGTYYIHVAGVSGATNTYALSIDTDATSTTRSITSTTRAPPTTTTPRRPATTPTPARPTWRPRRRC